MPNASHRIGHPPQIWSEEECALSVNKPTKIELSAAAAAMGRKGGKVSSLAKKRSATNAAKIRWARYAATTRKAK